MSDEERFEPIEAAADRLDSFIASLNMKMLPDSIHVSALRQGLPGVAKDLRAALARAVKGEG